MNQEGINNLLQPKKQNLLQQNFSNGQYRPKSTSKLTNNVIQQRPPSQQIQIINGAVKQKQFIHKKNNYIKSRHISQQLMNDDQNCYEITPQLLEEINIDDPIWKRILPENINLNEKQLIQLIDENADYFYHNLKLCACYKCKCGRCKCDATTQVKLKLNGNFLTNYDKDYSQKSRIKMTNPLNQRTYETNFMDQKTINLQSLYQSDFTQQPIEPQTLNNKKLHHQVGSVSSLTSYRSNFNEWGTNYHKYTPYPHISTSPDIRFLGTSQYKDSFSSPTRWNLNNSHYFKTSLTPIPTGQFDDQTTHKMSFLPYAIQHQQKLEKQKLYEKIPTFEGQFLSTEMNDYIHLEDQDCPAKRFQKIFRKQMANKLQKKQQNFIKSQIQQN